ncbi:MAG: hypothetical protein LAT64_02550 [Phycisphaerales bacterium]|nr:hypothetical protein [Planctomycetota bacterium]MCH8507638.1 hypothetical protein [Phycisphaerales bacterium]
MNSGDAVHDESFSQDAASGRELTRPQEAAILALLSEPSIAAAAEKAQVSERTLHRWLKEEPHFLAEYRRARREAFAQAIGLTQRSATAAVGTLLRVMHDTKATWSSRVAAATQVLKFARESIELDDLAVRVEQLEQRAADADAAAVGGASR